MLHRQVEIAGKSQADLIMGAPGPSRSDRRITWRPRWATRILGQFGMFGRIGKSRARAGRAGLLRFQQPERRLGAGRLVCLSAGVDPANMEQAIDLITQEIARFVSQPVSAEELADSQANYLGRLPLSLESNAGWPARC